MQHDGRALNDNAVDRIQTRFYKGIYDDHEIERVFESIRVQRKVLRELFNLFQEVPGTRESITDAIRNSTLRHFKELVAMEDPRKWLD